MSNYILINMDNLEKNNLTVITDNINDIKADILKISNLISVLNTEIDNIKSKNNVNLDVELNLYQEQIDKILSNKLNEFSKKINKELEKIKK